MTTSGPHVDLNSVIEPMCLEGVEYCRTRCDLQSYGFQPAQDVPPLQCCHGNLSTSGTFFKERFAMPCGSRKKAALTNFLRDISWCLMFIFVCFCSPFSFF